MLIVGGTLGQSILPAFIGYIIGLTSPFAMPVIVFLSCIMLCILFFTVHYLRLRILPVKDLVSIHRLDSSEHSSHPLNASSKECDDIVDDDEDDDVELVTIELHQ